MKKHIALITLLVLLTGLGTAAQSVKLDVTKIKTEPVPLQTSEYADIWVKVVNEGQSVAENTTIEFRPSFPFTADPGEQTRWNVGKILRGEEYHIHLQVKVDENAVQGNNTLRFVTETSQGVEIEHRIPIEVRTDDDTLVIDQLDFPARVGPGTANSMQMTLSNLGDGYLKNIDVSLDTSDDELPIVTSGTTRKRITRLAPGDSANASFTLNIDEEASNGVYKLPITLEYENEGGDSFTIDETTGIVVGGDSQLEVGINSREIDSPGQTGSVTLRLVNRGEGRARFVELGLQQSEDYEILSSDSVYLGNVDPDDYQTAEFELYVQEGVEQLQLPVELSYKDSQGQAQTETRTIETPLYTDEQLSLFRPQQSTNPLLLVAIIGVVIVGGYLYWRRRRRRG